MHAFSGLAWADRAAAREQATREAGAAWLARQGEAAGRDRLYLDGYDRVRIPRGERSAAIVFRCSNSRACSPCGTQYGLSLHSCAALGTRAPFGRGLMLIRRSRQ